MLPGVTMVHVLEQRAAVGRDHIGYTFLTDDDRHARHLSYRALDRRARAIAAVLQQHLRPRDRVVLLYPSGLDYVSAFFGALYAGAVAVPIYPPRPNRSLDRLEAILEDVDASVALGRPRQPHLLSLHAREADPLEPAGRQPVRSTSMPLILLIWRRGRDSNPRYGCPYAAFRVRCIQPLCHLSASLRHGLSVVGLYLAAPGMGHKSGGSKAPAQACGRANMARRRAARWRRRSSPTSACIRSRAGSRRSRFSNRSS